MSKKKGQNNKSRQDKLATENKAQADDISAASQFLQLAVAQIQQAMRDHDSAMEKLTESHGTIGRLSRSLGENGKIAMDHHLEQMVVAFQNHDALNQRLSHVCASLEAIIDQLDCTDRENSTEHWSQLVERIKSTFSTPQEWEVFGRIFGEEENNQHPRIQQGSSIELF